MKKKSIGIIIVLLIVSVVFLLSNKTKIENSGYIISIIILFAVSAKHILKNTLLGRLGIGTLSFPYNIYKYLFKKNKDVK